VDSVLRQVLASVAALALAACAALPKPVSPAGNGGFELQGRVAVRYGSDGASGNLAWRHSADSDELLITSFLGQGVARIRRSGGEVQLFAEGKEHRAPDAEALTEQVLGWRLPLGGLPDWVQGRPAPGGAAEVRRDGADRVVAFVQDQWKVEYQAFEGQRPSRLRLTRPNLEIRLIVDQWSG
jgi:outer membrane lipoprotein LolB